MIVEIIKISQIREETIDYNAYIFKINPGKLINFETANSITVLVNTLIIGGALKIILDFKDLKIIDSSGISALITFAKLIRKNNGDIVFCNVDAEITKIFSVVNLQSFIKIFNNEVEAENHFRYINE